MKFAVCVLVEHRDMYLTVCRRNEFDQWGFPGGKVDKFESNEEAAQRELREETGLQASLDELHPLYAGFDGEYWVVTYVLYGRSGTYYDNLRAETKDFAVDWAVESVLCDAETSPFAEYNIAVFNALRVFKSND